MFNVLPKSHDSKDSLCIYFKENHKTPEDYYHATHLRRVSAEKKGGKTTQQVQQNTEESIAVNKTFKNMCNIHRAHYLTHVFVVL